MTYTEAEYKEMFLDCGFDLPKGSKGMVRCTQHEDKHPSMHIDTTKGLYHCFSCGYGGRIDKKYYEEYGHSYGKKTSYNEDELKRLFFRRERPIQVQTKPQLFQASIQKYTSPVYKEWLNYRGIKPSVVDKAGAFYGSATISYVDDDGKKKEYTVRDRVMFPIYDEHHKMCSIEMRFPFLGTESERFKKTVKKVLYPKCSSVNLLYESYNLDKTQTLYLLEGLMDCLAFRSLTGIMNSTSIFGAMFTNKQKELVNEFPRVCYVYNNDVAGLNSLESLKSFYKGQLTELKPAGDFDDVGEMAIAKFDEVDKWLKTIH